MATNGSVRQASLQPPLGVGELVQAEQHYRQLVEQDPRNGDAWYQLGLLALRHGRHSVAIPSLEKAVALDPNQALVHHYLGTSHQALGQRDQAVHHFHQVVCLKPELAEAHNNWGIALAQQGQLPEALAAFTQALRLKPEYAEAHNNWGNTLVEKGDLDQAVVHFRQALSLNPHYPEANNNLALALVRQGKPEEALHCFQEALRLQPAYVDAQNNLGNLHRDQNNLEEAVACYRQVLAVRVDHAVARHHLAMVLTRQGQIEEAIACLHQSLLFNPEAVDTYNYLGVLFSQRDRLDEAAAAFRQATRLKPDNAEALNNLGNTLLRQQKTDEAMDCFQQALRLRQDYPHPYCNLATALMQQGKAEEAAGYYKEALRLQPDYIDAHFNLGNAYRTLGRCEEAIACFQQVLGLQPDNSGVRLNLGVALSEVGKLDEATEVLEEVLRRHPGMPQAFNSLGVNRMHQGRHEDALALFEEGIRGKPDDPEIHMNRALTMLLLGDYDAGWVEYEWRWQLKKAATFPYPQPMWDGSPLANGTIVLWGEQGLGDTLQFIRYAALVKERVGKVLVDCPGPLSGLLPSCPGIDGLAGAGAPGPTPDVQAPLLSLPRILGTSLANIPGSVPYLFVDSSARERWRAKMGSGKGLKVGIIWQGNPQFFGDRHRSIPLGMFRALGKVPGVQLFSLQKGKGSEQLEVLAEKLAILDLGKEFSADFRDAAAALVNLDLVVSVDTSIAHLAGALGVPVWVLLPFNPDWRWLREREDSPWYPSARLFRQSRWGDWEEVFQRVNMALGERARRPHQTRVMIQVSLTELLERAIREEIHQGRAEESWALLRQAGLPDTAEVSQLTGRLRAAQKSLRKIDGEMEALEATAEFDAGAGDLLRRYLQANHERAGSLSQFSAWLGGAPDALRDPGLGKATPGDVPPGVGRIGRVNAH